ncbi:hypothetical protein LTR33_016356 [Friedmanniomyces endolithicus]|nr:hypothetical protein LTR33_016356 [Friedmanniomyces endolithicus]
MQSALILAGAAIAQVANAHGHEARHARLHAKRVVVTDVEVDVVTVWETVTAGAAAAPTTQAQYVAPTSQAPSNYGPAPSAYSSAASSASVAAASSVYSSAASSISVAPVASSSSAAAPSSTLVTSVSSAVSVAAYSSSSAAAPSSYVASSSSTASSATAPSGSGVSASNLTPSGKKAGLSGYIGIQNTQSFSDMAPHISWYSDYTPNTPDEQGVTGIGMLWGANGSPCGSDMTNRLATYEQMMANNTIPSIMSGFYEPDCACTMSSDMSTSDAATQWESLIAPLAAKGTVLGSPSMCKQYDEDFLTPFKSAIQTDWDVTSIHINKPNVTEAQKDVEYYVQTYGKKVWVSEFACVNDQPSWSPCTDQTQIDTFINDVVSYFEGSSDVVAYGPSNGAGLGDAWPLTDSTTGELTATGTTYVNAIKGL